MLIQNMFVWLYACVYARIRVRITLLFITFSITARSILLQVYFTKTLYTDESRPVKFYLIAYFFFFSSCCSYVRWTILSYAWLYKQRHFHAFHGRLSDSHSLTNQSIIDRFHDSWFEEEWNNYRIAMLSNDDCCDALEKKKKKKEKEKKKQKRWGIVRWWRWSFARPLRAIKYRDCFILNYIRTASQVPWATHRRYTWL